MLPTTIQLKRKHACLLIHLEVNFFDIARAYGIPPRTLMAWRSHENDKWENDAYEGREPGPDENYSGEWPNEIEELDYYASMSLSPEHLEDPSLKRRYTAHLKKRSSSSAAKPRK